MANPKPVDNTNNATTYQLILSHPGSKYHCCSIKGTNKVVTVKVTIGNAMNQATSGARRVFCCGSPQNTRRNTRVKFNTVKPLTITKIPITQGLISAKPSAHDSIAQKLPNGSSVTIPAEPTTKAEVVAGMRDHRPPISVKS